MTIFLLKCHRPPVYGQRPQHRDATPPPTGPAVPVSRNGHELTWGNVVGDGTFDPTAEEDWKRLIDRCRQMPASEALRFVMKCAEQVMKIRILAQKGASMDALDGIRKLFAEITTDVDGKPPADDAGFLYEDDEDDDDA